MVWYCKIQRLLEVTYGDLILSSLEFLLIVLIYLVYKQSAYYAYILDKKLTPFSVKIIKNLPDAINRVTACYAICELGFQSIAQSNFGA